VKQRKSKTTLAEKISRHVEGDTPFERFTNLVRQIVPPESAVTSGETAKPASRSANKRRHHQK
jgi:hypothetical protein